MRIVTYAWPMARSHHVLSINLLITTAEAVPSFLPF